MPALIEPVDSIKIRAAEIIGLNSIDQCDSLPDDIIDYVDDNWVTTVEDIIRDCSFTREQLLELGATNV